MITCQVYFTDSNLKPKTNKAYFYNFALGDAKIGNIVEIIGIDEYNKETRYSNPVMIASVLDDEYDYIGSRSGRPVMDEETYNDKSIKRARVIKICKIAATTNNIIIEENDNMKNSFGMNFEFGKVPAGKFKLSMYGLAFSTGDNRFAVYNMEENEFTDVTEMTMDMDGVIFQMPCAIADVKLGDIIKHKGEYVLVSEACANGDIIVVNPFSASKMTIIPTKNIFGFNYVTKVMNMCEGMFGSIAPDANNPFGNMMPFMMMSSMNDGKSDNDFMKMMMFSSMMNGGNMGMDMTSNPMMAFMFMKNM